MRGPGPGWRVLVTGASSGLGRALAIELARAGCSLLLTARDLGRLNQSAEDCRRSGSPRVDVFCADLSSEEGLEPLLRWLSSNPPDAVVNNAGAGQTGPWVSGSFGRDTELVHLLIRAPLALTRFLSAHWRTTGKGGVLNIASTGAFQPGPLTAVYYAAKAFVFSWSVALALEEPRWSVTTLCPGALKTGFSAAAGKKDVPGAPGPEKTARIAVRAWQRGRGVVVPGFQNKVTVFLSRVFPPRWSAIVVEAIQRRMIQGRAGGK